ncbi:unnamed protein product [Acanthosepion pharaonis]|uniref:Uncharacterized protein n=1 Tax=Acanthosepion pharaonis TaxID=158019 RepID=A0A812B5T7_ACAPH|nr:unnamed protein product [Sepia pharaonis]
MLLKNFPSFVPLYQKGAIFLLLHLSPFSALHLYFMMFSYLCTFLTFLSFLLTIPTLFHFKTFFSLSVSAQTLSLVLKFVLFLLNSSQSFSPYVLCQLFLSFSTSFHHISTKWSSWRYTVISSVFTVPATLQLYFCFALFFSFSFLFFFSFFYFCSLTHFVFFILYFFFPLFYFVLLTHFIFSSPLSLSFLLAFFILSTLPCCLTFFLLSLHFHISLSFQSIFFFSFDLFPLLGCYPFFFIFFFLIFFLPFPHFFFLSD